MTARAKVLLEEVLQLPERDRARVAAALLASIHDEPEPGAEKEWAEEVERRAREPDPRGVPWSEVRKRLVKTRR